MFLFLANGNPKIFESTSYCELEKIFVLVPIPELIYIFVGQLPQTESKSSLVEQFKRDLYPYILVIVQKLENDCFSSFLALNSETGGTISPKINPNLPFSGIQLLNLLTKIS